jgi:CBS domain-containing protein
MSDMAPSTLSGNGITLAGSRVSDAMTEGIVSCTPDTPLRAVARLMATGRIHAVYVFSDEGALWSVVSDLDLVAAARSDIDSLTARDACVRPLLTIAGDEPLDRAARMLAEHGVTHLVVLDSATAYPCGVVSALDIARLIAFERPVSACARRSRAR